MKRNQKEYAFQCSNAALLSIIRSQRGLKRIHQLEIIVSTLKLNQDSQLPAISLLNDSNRPELDVRDFVRQFFIEILTTTVFLVSPFPDTAGRPGKEQNISWKISD